MLTKEQIDKWRRNLDATDDWIIALCDQAEAAIDLLAACKAVVDHDIPGRDVGPLMNQLHESIAKAESLDASGKLDTDRYQGKPCADFPSH